MSHPAGQMDQKGGKIAAILDATKETLTENIEKVINRGENIQDIEATSEGLRDTSLSFRQSANQLKRQQQWERLKMYMCIFIFFAVASLVIAMYICGVQFDQC